jgi:hypothetical protein
VEGNIILQRGMEETPEKGKGSLHFAHANGMIERMNNEIYFLCQAFILVMLRAVTFFYSKSLVTQFIINKVL